MNKTQRIHNEEQLLSLLKRDIEESNRQAVKIIAGHLPLIYDERERQVHLGLDRWGQFSSYTLELGARLIGDAGEIGKEGKLIFVVDDDVELPKIEEDGKIRRKDVAWSKSRRKRIYEGQKLPVEYNEILERYGFTEKDLVWQDRGNGVLTPLISEKILKRDAIASGKVALNECSLAMKGMIFDPKMYNSMRDYLITFIPGQCKGNICDGILDRIGLDTSTVFFPHMEALGGLFDTGNGFVKMGDVMPVSEMYSSGGILYRKDVK